MHLEIYNYKVTYFYLVSYVMLKNDVRFLCISKKNIEYIGFKFNCKFNNEKFLVFDKRTPLDISDSKFIFIRTL